jgi:CDP-diacylglycerol---glycerol-3-phosphate 3-phosphatidyltransferase
MPSASLKNFARGFALPVGRALSSIGITANAVTFAGLLFAGGAGVLLGFDRRLAAFACLAGSGLCDLLDGAVARARGGGGSTFGAAFDSTADRYGEALILAGVLLFRIRQGGIDDWFVWLWVLTLVGSFLTSYVRARAEGLGLRCEVGLLERPERLGLMALFPALGPRFAPWILGALALGSHITFVQRLIHIRRTASSKG